MPAPLRLPDGEAHLYYLFQDEVQDPELLAEYRTWMTEEERARCDRYYFEHSRKEYLLTRALVRASLSLYHPIHPSRWRFRSTQHGRPELAEPAEPAELGPLRFNLSNTRGLIALLLVRGADVGVDVEDREHARQTVEIAERYFSPSEVDAMMALPPHARRDRFFQYWTLKEAYIKARGLGLAIPLDKFSFVLDPADAPIRIAIEPELGDDAGRWQFAQLGLSDRHACAAALSPADGRPVSFVLRRTVPGVRHTDERAIRVRR